MAGSFFVSYYGAKSPAACSSFLCLPFEIAENKSGRFYTPNLVAWENAASHLISTPLHVVLEGSGIGDMYEGRFFLAGAPFLLFFGHFSSTLST